MAAAEEVTSIWHTKSATYWKLLVCFPSPYTVNGCLRMACKRQTQELKITVNDELITNIQICILPNYHSQNHEELIRISDCVCK